MSHSMRIRTPERGFTLIELMIAATLGLLVIGGVGAVFMSSSSTVKALDQLATLQESGRYAMARLKADIGMTNAQYCSSTGGNARSTTLGGISIDDLRAPKSYVDGDLLLAAMSDVTTPWNSNGYPAKPTRPFAMPDYLFMRGYDCSTGTCSPVDPSNTVTGIPAQGTSIGKRVPRSSILTLRYLDPSMGWDVNFPGGTSITSTSTGGADQITLTPLSGEPPSSTYQAGDLMMLSDCSLSQVFAVSGMKPDTSNNFDTPNAMTGARAVRLFDFNKAFKTVTYFLQVVDAGGGNTTGALIRRENGVNEELVRGIERLDFRYAVMTGTGGVQMRTANEIDTSTDTDCPWIPSDDAIDINTNLKGCQWRAVIGIEINLLASGINPNPRLQDFDLVYTYADKDQPTKPADHTVIPMTHQGFPEKLLRREFAALVSIRNYNP